MLFFRILKKIVFVSNFVFVNRRFSNSTLNKPGMNYGMLTEIMENYIVSLFELYQDPSLTFHNLTHTRTVVSHAGEISAYYKLPEQDLLVVRLAALVS